LTILILTKCTIAEHCCDQFSFVLELLPKHFAKSWKIGLVVKSPQGQAKAQLEYQIEICFEVQKQDVELPVCLK